MKKKIAFIGVHKTFRYQDIGGMNSIVRRLSNSLVENTEIFHLSYGSDVCERGAPINGIEQLQFQSFKSMLSFVSENEISDLIIVYLKPIDYLSIFFFRLLNPAYRFHFLVSGLPSTRFKQFIFKFIARNVLNGRVFCISRQLASLFKTCGRRVVHVMPPVDDAFFVDKRERGGLECRKFRVAFMGRLDLGKGADIAIDYFEKSALPPDDFEFFIYGYPLEGDTDSMAIHERLVNDNGRINYVQSPLWDGYSPAVDKFLADIIDAVDIFYLPYRTIDSTIDTPLVPLEILARRGQFLAPDFSQIVDIVPSSLFLMPKREIYMDSRVDDRILMLIKRASEEEQWLFSDFRTSLASKLVLQSIYE